MGGLGRAREARGAGGAKLEAEMKIDVALEPAEIERLGTRDLGGTHCVVLDVLRATSAMVTGLAEGVEAICPVTTIEEALAMREGCPGVVLGGERHGDRIEGFEVGNSPFEYRQLSGRKVVTTTTNGTVALRACGGARKVAVGAVLNLGAVTEWLRVEGPERLLVVCAGTFETLALEDVWAAGRLLEGFPGADWTDSARVALAVSGQWKDPLEALLASRNGRVLVGKGRRAEVEWCATESLYPVVGEMEGGWIRSGAFV
jgi:2-phosphosulfolactate phosphatase